MADFGLFIVTNLFTMWDFYVGFSAVSGLAVPKSLFGSGHSQLIAQSHTTLFTFQGSTTIYRTHIHAHTRTHTNET